MQVQLVSPLQNVGPWPHVVEDTLAQVLSAYFCRIAAAARPGMKPTMAPAIPTPPTLSAVRRVIRNCSSESANNSGSSRMETYPSLAAEFCVNVHVPPVVVHCRKKSCKHG
jgi:hypothetical protein